MNKEDNGSKDFLEQEIGGLDMESLKSREKKLFKSVMESVEKPLIEKALERTYGNQLKAAKILGINRNTLRTKIKKFGIKVEKWKI